MSYLNYRSGELFVENVSARQVASEYGTPTYIYSRAAIEENYLQFDKAFEDCAHKTCYAVKANGNIAILSLLASLGSGFDVVSGGELERVIHAGGNPAGIVFSGVGKQADEMARALEVGIKCFNVESKSELIRLNKVAQQCNKVAPISIRVNPDVDARTHPYIATGLAENKFGVSTDQIIDIYSQAKEMPFVRILGIDCHIGSQLTELDPFREAMECILSFVDELARNEIRLQHIDLGGGLGVRYQNEQPIDIDAYASALIQLLGERELELLLEPGRYLMANTGILLSRVIYLKTNLDRHFAVIDAGMNDLLRPALYQSWHGIHAISLSKAKPQGYDVVGPICETADFFGRNRDLAIEEGDYLAIDSAGAYGSVMSSNYNGRNKPAEILIDDDKMFCIRTRETFRDQIALESVPALQDRK